MKRRSFLKTAAALFPAAGLESLALGQAPSPVSPDLHIVPAGEDRLGESHSLGYSSILFKVMPRETNGGLFIIEHIHLENAGPALHLHTQQEEWFYVVEGEVLFQIGDTRKRLRAGDSVAGPRLVPHAFAGASEKPARMLIAFTPAGKMEQFFHDVATPNAPKLRPEDWARYDLKYIGPSPFAT
jgi:quercetin dioxygenase-like cupin family protein